MTDNKTNYSKDDPETQSNKVRTSIKRLSRRLFKRRDERSEEQERVKSSRVKLRILPIWLRIILVFLLFVIAIVVGLSVGYGYIGDGNLTDVFKKETWAHILNLISGEE